ncbi:hypothetical protein SLEP1_g4888 [Rubroshorea leprosula]|uniref:Secreted protein n=1 Tax=Rubroshorea leprosula TaxID=152421 RepID=A0AAV5HW35_9ROSI|nr:hypothetical protein SLEP1_g4888 [Rubroshorea leprosula]
MVSKLILLSKFRALCTCETRLTSVRRLLRPWIWVLGRDTFTALLKTLLNLMTPFRRACWLPPCFLYNSFSPHHFGGSCMNLRGMGRKWCGFVFG